MVYLLREDILSSRTPSTTTPSLVLSQAILPISIIYPPLLRI